MSKRIYKSIFLQGTNQEDSLHYKDCELAQGSDEICDCNERDHDLMTIAELVFELKGALHDKSMELADLNKQEFELRQTIFHRPGSKPTYDDMNDLDKIQAQKAQVLKDIQPALDFIKSKQKDK